MRGCPPRSAARPAHRRAPRSERVHDLACLYALQLRDCAQARLRDFDALLDEVGAEELEVVGMLVEVARREHSRQHRHVGVELHAHQAVDHGAGDELVAVDAAIDHQRAADDRVEAAAERQALGHQRDLERARHVEMRDLRGRHALLGQLADQRVARLVHDVGVPARADHRNAAVARHATPGRGRGNGGRNGGNDSSGSLIHDK